MRPEYDESFANTIGGNEEFHVLPAWVWMLCQYLLVGIICLAIASVFKPLTATILIYGVFAWGDLATAVWLRFRDPVPQRGKSIFWFMLSYAMCKATLLTGVLTVGFLLLGCFVFLFLVPLLGLVDFFKQFDGPAVWTDEELTAAISFRLMIAIFGLAPAAVLTAIGCFTTKRNGMKVWMDGSISRARRQRTWPPGCDSLYNQADGTLLVATAAVIFGTIMGLLFACLLLPELSRIPVGCISFVIVTVGWHLIVAGAVAKTPPECWPETSTKNATSP